MDGGYVTDILKMCMKKYNAEKIAAYFLFHLKMTGTSCTDDARVNYPHFKSHTFLEYQVFHKDVIHLHRCY